MPFTTHAAPGSRLGTTLEAFEEELVPLLDGIHMHTLCEQNSDDLEKTVEALEDKFGKWLPQMKWLNLGGGHHITRADYDRERLVRIIRRLREKVPIGSLPGTRRGSRIKCGRSCCKCAGNRA